MQSKYHFLMRGKRSGDFSNEKPEKPKQRTVEAIKQPAKARPAIRVSSLNPRRKREPVDRKEYLPPIRPVVCSKCNTEDRGTLVRIGTTYRHQRCSGYYPDSGDRRPGGISRTQRGGIP